MASDLVAGTTRGWAGVLVRVLGAKAAGFWPVATWAIKGTPVTRPAPNAEAAINFNMPTRPPLDVCLFMASMKAPFL